MKLEANSVSEYLNKLPDDKKESFLLLYESIRSVLPKELEETFLYNMITYVVSKDVYPAGYHVTKDTPLPYLSLAVQKHSINVYHLGLYADPTLLKWYEEKHYELFQKKPNMGKSCLRFKTVDSTVIQLITELIQKQTVSDFIKLYDAFKPKGA